MLIVVPAYGRDYKNAKDAEKDFQDGKDFIINDISSRWDGKPCSIRDLPKGEQVEIRYKKKTLLTVVTV